MEDMILFRTLRDMNCPKLLVEDLKLFMHLMSDLFPGVEPPVVDYGSLKVCHKSWDSCMHRAAAT